MLHIARCCFWYKVLYNTYIIAMAFIHSRKVLHRDLKCDNILIDKNYAPKVNDFGAAITKDEIAKDVKAIVAGTPQYIVCFFSHE